MALKKFLRKEYDNLLTIDVVCHGVPSPGVWRSYLKGCFEKEEILEAIKFSGNKIEYFE